MLFAVFNPVHQSGDLGHMDGNTYLPVNTRKKAGENMVVIPLICSIPNVAPKDFAKNYLEDLRASPKGSIYDDIIDLHLTSKKSTKFM